MKFTIKNFHEKYTNDDVCLDEIFKQQYSEIKECPKCHKEFKYYRIKGRKCYSCQYCANHIYPLANTIFYKSETSLKTWFYAIYLFSISKNGISAKELERQIGVTYKTAWRMAKQIRLLFDITNKKLKNEIEVDETYIGGISKGKRGRGANNKSSVVGIVERKGDINAVVTGNTKSSTIMPLIKDSVQLGSVIYTDEYKSYFKVEKLGYQHKHIHHGIGEYVNGDIHTNTIEGFWSQLKRSINGTYHAVSPKYLQNYVDEFSFRYNLRKAPVLFFPILEQVCKIKKA